MVLVSGECEQERYSAVGNGACSEWSLVNNMNVLRVCTRAEWDSVSAGKVNIHEAGARVGVKMDRRSNRVLMVDSDGCGECREVVIELVVEVVREWKCWGGGGDGKNSWRRWRCGKGSGSTP